MRKRTAGITNGIIAAVSYGTNPLFALPLYNGGIGVNSVLFYRYAFAVVIYGLWLKFARKIPFQISPAQALPLFIFGLLFSFSSLTLFEAFRYIEAGIACTVLFIYPVIVAVIMAVFYKENLGKKIIFSIFLTSSGIILLYNGTPEGRLDLRGIILVLLSALFYALYMTGVNKNKVLCRINKYKISFYIMLFGLIVYVFNLRFCTELQIINKPLLWLSAIALSIIPTIISLETVNTAIKLAGAAVTAVLGALEPLTAIFFGVIFFGEHLTARIAAGVILILYGVVLIVISQNVQHKG